MMQREGQVMETLDKQRGGGGREREREKFTILDKVGGCPFFPAREREREVAFPLRVWERKAERGSLAMLE